MEEQLMIDQPFITDPDVIAQFNELGIDPTGKTADQLQAEIDTLMIKTGATTFFDPKDPLDYLTLGLGLTGIGTGAAVGIKGLRTAFINNEIVYRFSKVTCRYIAMFLVVMLHSHINVFRLKGQ